MNPGEQARRIAFSVLVSAALVVSAADASGPDEAGEVWRGEIRRVQATADPRDDVALASKLLKAAKTTGDHASAVASLCEITYELGMKHPSGFETAVEAMKLLAKTVPDKETACREKALVARRKQYYATQGAERRQAGERFVEEALALAVAREKAGEYEEALKVARQGLAMAARVQSPLRRDLQGLVKRLMQLVRIRAQVRRCEARLKAKPDDRVARDMLIRLNLIELDSPAEAAKYLTPDCDERMRTYIPLADKDDDDMPERACMELGNWYRSLAKEASVVGKPSMLRRTARYYRLFLDKHLTDDLVRTKVNLELKSVEAELAKLERGQPGVWRDLLSLVKVSKHCSGGPWARDGRLVGMKKPSRPLLLKFGTVMFPVVPKGSYELEVSFSRAEGSGPVGLYLPIGSTRITVAMSRKGGEHSALERIQGKQDDTNKVVTKPGRIVNGRTVNLHAKVVCNDKDKTGEIDVKLNGEKYLYWKGELSQLARGLEPDIGDANAPGMATLNSRFVVSAARIRVLSGKLEAAKGTTGGPAKDPKEWEDDLRRWWRRRR